jgi:parallel beta-helix repeat protein
MHIIVGRRRAELLRKLVSGIMLTLLLTSMFALAFNIRPAETAEGTGGVFDDDFETYNLGNLAGQGGWSVYWPSDNVFQVVDTLAHSGIKSAYCQAYDTFYRISKYGVKKQSGIQSIYVYFSDVTVGLTNQILLYLRGDAGGGGQYLGTYGFKYDSSTSQWRFIYQNGSAPYNLIVLVDDVSKQTWHSIQAEFDEPNWKYRLKLDNGDWSGWLDFFDYLDQQSINGVEGFSILTYGAETWFDTIDGEISFSTGTVYIRADGSIDPPTAPIQRYGDTYFLTGDIFSEGSGISIARNNMTLDGLGYTLIGTNAMSSWGIFMSYIHNVTIKNMTISNFGNTIGSSRIGGGIYLYYGCSNIKISVNNIMNGCDGVKMMESSYVSLNENNITNNLEGIVLMHNSENVHIVGNALVNNSLVAVYIHSSPDNTVAGNKVSQDRVVGSRAFLLNFSPNNTIIENHFSGYDYGFVIGSSNDSRIFHNSFINNARFQTSLSENVWDDGYPSGGNCWSDYIDIDLYSGPVQNETGTDGIWDHPYFIDVVNQDRYPLVDMRVKGIDVSYYQGVINWTKVSAARYKFAFAKATEGDNRPPVIIDPQFITNMNNGRNAGLLMGAYHFAHPEANNAADEARFFISVARPYLRGGYLRPALDLERGSSLGKELLSEWVHLWMETVENETGVEPIIYTNPDYATNHLEASIGKYDLWIAHWTYDLSIPPSTGEIWDSWDYWQYSNSSSVPGINGYVDSDVFARGYDIGITELNVSKTAVGQGCTVNTSISIINYGAYTEVFKVTSYANTSLIASQNIVLASGSFTTITFIWNTTGFARGNYTISAYAEPIFGETITSDNTYIGRVVMVTILGDVNGDSKVNSSDLFDLSEAYRSTFGSITWNSNCDVNGDNKVDILDLFLQSKNYGKTDP